MLKKNPKIRQEDIAKTLGVNVKTVKRQMAEMQCIKYIGRGYSGHWTFEEKSDSDES